MKYISPDSGEWIDGKGYRKKILLTQEDLNCNGALVQMVEIPAHSEVPFHHHKKMTEVFHIIEGAGMMTVGGTEYHLSAGDTLTTEPSDMHNAVNPFDAPLRYIVFKTNVTEDDSYWPSA